MLCCWEFLLRVKRISLLMTSWMLLVCKLEVCDRRARAGSVAPLHPHEGRRGSFAARLGVSIEGSAQCSDGAFGTNGVPLVCRIGGVWPSREGGERRAPASPRGTARFFCCAVGHFLEGRAQCSDGAFGTSGVPLVCGIGGARPLLEGGERRSPAAPQEAVRFFCCTVVHFS